MAKERTCFSSCSIRVCVLFVFCSVFASSYAFSGQAVAICMESLDSPCNQVDDLNAGYYGNLWLNVMDSYDTTVLDYTIFWNEVTDRTKHASGQDHINNNLDAADRSLFVSHGGRLNLNGVYYYQIWLTSDVGDPESYSCEASSFNWLIGNDDAEFVHGLSCQSAYHTTVFNESTGYHALSNALHGYGGFHGTANNGNWDNADDFAEDAWETTDSVSWAWVDDLTEIAFFDGSSGYDCATSPYSFGDLCAVAIAQGTTDSLAIDRLWHEDYNTDFQDPQGEGVAYLWIAGCDPCNGGALPSGPPPV